MADAWDGVDTKDLSVDATAAVCAVRAARADAAAWEKRYAELLAENRRYSTTGGAA